MANKVWQNISYNQSYWAEINRLQVEWRKIMEEHSKEAENYQPVVHDEKIVKGSDVY